MNGNKDVGKDNSLSLHVGIETDTSSIQYHYSGFINLIYK